MEDQIRQSDFQKAWPYAMARAMRETTQLAHLLDLLIAKSDAQLKSVIALAPLMSELVDAVTQRHEQAVERATNVATAKLEAQVTKIEDAATAILNSQSKFLDSFNEERLALAKTREVLDDQRLDISRAKKELDLAKSNFNSLNLFSRILKRV